MACAVVALPKKVKAGKEKIEVVGRVGNVPQRCGKGQAAAKWWLGV